MYAIEECEKTNPMFTLGILVVATKKVMDNIEDHLVEFKKFHKGGAKNDKRN